MSLSVTLRGACCAVAAVTILSGTAAAQSIEVGRDVLVLAAPPWAGIVEPHVAAHPERPGHLIAAAMVIDTAGAPSPRTYCASLLSLDGGLTWAAGRHATGNCADPWLAVTGSGEAVFSSLGMHPANGAPDVWGLLIARSADGGITWNDTILSLGREHDRPTMAADPRPEAARSVVIFSGQGLRLDDGPLRWSVFVARSVNAGRSFRQPITVIPSNLNLNSEEAVVLKNGTILASFVDFQRNATESDRRVNRRAGMLEHRRIWMLRSTDDGRTFSPPLLASEHCGMSAYDVAADLSEGPHAGRVYLACRPSVGSGVLLHHSDDSGEIWSAPRAIPGAATTGDYQSQPRMAVNRDGAVAITWLDAGDNGASGCYRVVAAASTDGGSTFTEPIPLSQRTCADPARNGFAQRRWPMGGDYFGLTAAADGRFHALWADGRRGPFELWSTTLVVRP
jgi:hypothetical protein